VSGPWGATKDEWLHFDMGLGLTADLLPVVSNPTAEISPDSRMKGKGKTPSIYNGQHKVAGIPKWTDRKTTGAQVERWAKESDYGICIQTRSVRGLDIDVPDVRLADRITDAFLSALAQGPLPERMRPGTGKRLFAFELPGDLGKRSFKVEGGLVEFLATGQQFVAIGTHPSGTRYTWSGGLPASFPVVAADDFERAWAHIRDEFATDDERRSERREGSGSLLGADEPADDVATWLAEHAETYGIEQGKLYVACPFKDGHSGDSGETEAAWLIAGTKGYARGHFECLHASCAGRSDAEFLHALGYKAGSADDFDDVSAEQPPEDDAADIAALYAATAKADGVKLPTSSPKVKTVAHPDMEGSLPLPGFIRDKQGEIEPLIENVVKAVSAAHACGYQIRFDTFRDELMISEPGVEQWRSFEDADAVQLRVNLASIRFKPVGKELMRDALTLAAREAQFDSAIMWLNEVVPKWDGVQRIASFYPRYFKTEDTPYTRACGEYVWTAHAGRVLEPGVKADMAPILMGAQGLRKSSGVAAISPAEDFFSEFTLDVGDTDIARKMRGCLVGELGELQGLNSRSAEAIRAWVVRRFEEWTPKYMERKAKFARRLLFHGTTNVEQFLADETGERRWLPMMVLDFVDVDAIVRDRLQLWAEGRERFVAGGVCWQEAERLAKAEHGKFKVHDEWEQKVQAWLDEPDLADETPRIKGWFSSADVLMGCLGFDLSRIDRRAEMRVAKVLKDCGMENTLRRSLQAGGKPQRRWFDTSNSDLA
jgi:hypothetical protein